MCSRRTSTVLVTCRTSHRSSRRRSTLSARRSRRRPRLRTSGSGTRPIARQPRSSRRRRRSSSARRFPSELSHPKLTPRTHRKLVKHVTIRSAEAAQRPRATDAFKVVLASADAFAASARLNTTASESKKELPRHTTVEIDALAKLAADGRTWFVATVKAQDGKKAHEDPVLRVADLERRAKEIESEVAKLRKKKAPRKPKVVASSSSSSSTATSSSASASSDEPAPEATASGERPKDEL